MNRMTPSDVAWPTGAPYHRQGEHVVPGEWYRSNWRGAEYELGPKKVKTLHTGDDLLLKGQSCAFKPVYAILGGVATFVQDVRGTTWGNIIVLQHEYRLYSRYAHLDKALVRQGDYVAEGQHIGTIGNAHGLLPYHLHVDVSNTPLLGKQPLNWPGMNWSTIRDNYLDVLDFIRSRMTDQPFPPDTAAALLANLQAVPPDTPVTIILGVPPVREPRQTVNAYVVQAQDLVKPAPVAPPTPPAPVEVPADAETMVVKSDIGLKVRIAPAGDPLIGSTGQNVVLPDKTTVKVRGSTEAVLKGTMYHWAELFEPAHGYVARELLVNPT